MRPQNMLDILHGYLSTDPAFSDGTLLDEWVSEVVETGDHGFENGLLGLGWLICYLLQKNYIQGDVDEILTDVDDTIYKLAIKEVLESEYHVNTLLYFVTYYQQRLQYRTKTHFYRSFTHFECLKLLLEKLNLFMLREPLKDNEIIGQKIDVILKYTFLLKAHIDEKLVEEALYTTIEELNLFFGHTTPTLDQITKFHLAILQYKNPHWEKKTKALLDSIKAPGPNPSPWVSLIDNDIWKQEHFIRSAQMDVTNKIFLFLALTNVITES